MSNRTKTLARPFCGQPSEIGRAAYSKPSEIARKVSMRNLLARIALVVMCFGGVTWGAGPGASDGAASDGAAIDGAASGTAVLTEKQASADLTDSFGILRDNYFNGKPGYRADKSYTLAVTETVKSTTINSKWILHTYLSGYAFGKKSEALYVGGPRLQDPPKFYTGIQVRFKYGNINTAGQDLNGNTRDIDIQRSGQLVGSDVDGAVIYGALSGNVKDTINTNAFNKKTGQFSGTGEIEAFADFRNRVLTDIKGSRFLKQNLQYNVIVIAGKKYWCVAGNSDTRGDSKCYVGYYADVGNTKNFVTLTSNKKGIEVFQVPIQIGDPIKIESDFDHVDADRQADGVSKQDFVDRCTRDAGTLNNRGFTVPSIEKLLLGSINGKDYFYLVSTDNNLITYLANGKWELTHVVNNYKEGEKLTLVNCQSALQLTPS